MHALTRLRFLVALTVLVGALAVAQASLPLVFAQAALPVCGNGQKESLIGAQATRTTAAAITAYLESITAGALDVDGNGVADALSDGLTITKYLDGVRGNGLVDGTVHSNGSRTTPGHVLTFLNDNAAAYDVDGNGVASSADDGALIVRYLFTFRGAALVGEQCDDGNTEDGDGCSAQCTAETLPAALVISAPAMPPSRQLLAGTQGDAVLRFDLRAEHADIELQHVRIDVSEESAAIDRLLLYRDADTTPFATATLCPELLPSFCVSVLPPVQLIAQGTTATMTVRPLLKNDGQGAVSQQDIRFRVFTDGITARRASSQQNVEPTDADGLPVALWSNPHDVVLAKIVSIADGFPVATAPVPQGQNREIGRFAFTAAVNNNVQNGLNAATLSGVVFTVASANVEFDPASFRLYRSDVQGVHSSCTATAPVNGSFKVLCPAAGLDASILSGQVASFSLSATIDRNAVDPLLASSLQVSLRDFHDRVRTTFGTADGDSSILWTDEEGSFFWVEHDEPVVSSNLLQREGETQASTPATNPTSGGSSGGGGGGGVSGGSRGRTGQTARLLGLAGGTGSTVAPGAFGGPESDFKLKRSQQVTVCRVQKREPAFTQSVLQRVAQRLSRPWKMEPARILSYLGDRSLCR